MLRDRNNRPERWHRPVSQDLTAVRHHLTDPHMIRSFRHKGLAGLWAKGSSARVDRKLQDRILLRLDALEAAAEASDLNLPGFDFHTLRGPRPVRYAVHVNGPWCLTFEFADGDAIKVDLEQYQ